MSNYNKLIFATNNFNKVKEIQALVGDKFEILSLKDVNCFEEIPETADTLMGNAILKAEYLNNKLNIDCFADDTGLMVESLNNEPGVFSARYAGEQRNSEDNMDLLLQKLGKSNNRAAKFQTAICLILKGEKHFFTGEVEGEIALQRSGQKGFGYDPIFIPEGHTISFAEMDLDEKNKISHRARAMKQLIDFLGSI